LCAENVDRRSQEKSNGCGAGIPRALRGLSDDFPNCIMTGDETWVSHLTPENKRQSMQWRRTHSHGDDMAKRAGRKFLWCSYKETRSHAL
jgi:hypothetical protein